MTKGLANELICCVSTLSTSSRGLRMNRRDMVTNDTSEKIFILLSTVTEIDSFCMRDLKWTNKLPTMTRSATLLDPLR